MEESQGERGFYVSSRAPQFCRSQAALLCSEKGSGNTIIYWAFYSFFFFNFLKFYWSIVDLQCCDNFCCTPKWFSYTRTHIHSFLDSFPTQTITEYWIEFPVPYISSNHSTYHSMHMPIPNPQPIHPHQTQSLTVMFQVVSLCHGEVFCSTEHL